MLRTNKNYKKRVRCLTNVDIYAAFVFQAICYQH